MMRNVVTIGFALLGLARAAFAETGEQYPDNRVRGAVYGYEFGVTNVVGLREKVFPFASPRPLGTVMFASGDRLSVFAQRTDDRWVALSRLDAEGRPTSDAAMGKNASFWYAPRDFVAKAVKAAVEIPADAARERDGNYHARVGGLHTWSNRWFNVSSFATPFVSSGLRLTKAVNDGQIANAWDCWRNESNGRPVSPENAPLVGLAWVKPVTITSLALSFCHFAAAEIQVYVGKDHPKDGAERDWKTVKTFDRFRTWYPTRSLVTLLDLDAPVTTRGVRVRIVAPADARRDSHPHVVNRTKGGCVVELGELMALGTGASFKSAQADFAAAQPKAAGLPISFDMPFDGLATLVIEDSSGRRVRNLVSAQPFKKGRNTVLWDGSDDLGRDVDAACHGLYRLPFRPVAPGDYRVRGIVHSPLRTFYEFAIYAAGNPPWCVPDHTGAFLSNHDAPQAALSLPPDRVLFGANISEGPDGLAICDLTGKKIGGRYWVGGIWTVAAYLAADVGDRATADIDYYVGGIVWGDKKTRTPPLLRLTAIRKDGQEDRYGGLPLPSEGAYKSHVGGLAVWNGDLTVALTTQDKILVTNPVTHAWREISVPAPRGLAYEKGGTLLALSGHALVRISPSGRETLLDGLDEPVGLAVDGTTVCISCRGESHQVWVVALTGASGAKVVRKIGRPGRPQSGVYDENHLNNPKGVCLDAEGKLWVTEEDFLPKRVSCWNLTSGRLVHAIYGPAKYGAGGMFDPRDPTRFYYNEGGGLMEFKVDWTAGTSRLNRVLLRPEERGDDRRVPPERVIYLKDGRRLFTNCWNASPTNGSGAGLWTEENDRLVPVVAYGPKGCGGVSFVDGGAAYVQKTPDANVVRFLPVGTDEKGLPVYDFTHGEKLFGNARNSGSTGGNQMVVDARGNAFFTAPVGDSPSHSVCGGRDGVITWSYPNMWPGLHAGHSAPRNAPKGRLTAVTRLLGDAVGVAGTDETVVAINGNHGEIYFMTTDGLFIDNVLENCATGRRWTFGSLPRGAELAGVSPGDEHFWPTINRLDDGRIYLIVGKDVSCVVRLEGLDTIRRLPPSTIRVTSEAQADLQAAREAAEQHRRAAEGLGTLVCTLGDAPTVDGDLSDWDAQRFVTIENRGVAAYFNSNSKPYDIRGALKATKTHLYAAWKCQGVSRLAYNSGESSELQFKTGGAVDLMLRTDPGAQGKGPQVGDVRVLASLVRKVEKNREQWVPRVMMYEQKVKGADASARVSFTSPVMTVTFDRVTDITDKCRFARGQTGDYELELPLDLIGFTPTAGVKTIGDIGVLRGADGATLARLYWANKATGIVSDVPSEAMLVPKNWGPIEVRSVP